ncbi:MAG: stage V sporulation protein S [Thermomicrobiales bacterium]
MNRFFSKLDLRDIKIDPAGSRFPPDADDHEDDAPEVVTAAEPEVAAEVVAPDVAVEPERAPEPVTPLATYEFSYERTTTSASFTSSSTSYSVEETTVVANGQVDGVATNGGLQAIDAVALLGAEFIDAVDVDEVLKVSARSRPSAVAGAIAGVVRECGRAEVQAIGAGATNQAVKAVAIARDYLRETGIDAVCLPAFIDVTIENEDRTAIRLVVEVR